MDTNAVATARAAKKLPALQHPPLQRSAGVVAAPAKDSPRLMQLRALRESAQASPQLAQARQLHLLANRPGMESGPAVRQQKHAAQSAGHTPTTLSAGVIGAAALAAGVLGSAVYAMYRHAGVSASLTPHGPEAEGDKLFAQVNVTATGLKAGDWVDYQIKWGAGAVPGFNGQQLVAPHLEQVIDTAGGWRTDRPPLGQPDPLARVPGNHRYADDGTGTASFEFIDGIEQHQLMPQGDAAAGRQWGFRAIVRNRWNVPIRTSNEVVITWPLP